MFKADLKTLIGFLSLALIGLLVFRIVPVIWAIAGSFSGQTLMGETTLVGLKNYLTLFSDPAFWNSFNVTLIFNLLINPIQIILAFILALLVLRPGRGIVLYRTAFVLPMAISSAVTAIIWMILLDQALGPVNGLLEAIGVGRQPFFSGEDQALGSFIAIASWKAVGYWMLFLLAGLLMIPRELHEAAALDGAGSWTRFIYITLPLMKRPLAFVLVADSAINFLFFAPIYIISGGGPNGSTSVLMFEAYQAAFVFLNEGRSLALSTIILLVIAVFAVFELHIFRTENQ